MNNLAADDEKLRVSYQRIQNKYLRAHGLLNFFAMKLWTRALQRWVDPPS
jgi:hypothetical protein